MYCTFCNSQLPDGVFVCAVCGHDNTPKTNAYEEAAPVAEEATVAEETPVAEETEYAPEEAAPAPVKAKKVKAPKKVEDPLSAGIGALVWGALSALMGFGGLFFAMSFECAIAGIVMALVSKSKAKALKAYEGTVGAALAKGAGALSMFGLIASIYVLVSLVILVAVVIFIYVLYFILMFVGIIASTGSFYYYY